VNVLRTEELFKNEEEKFTYGEWQVKKKKRRRQMYRFLISEDVQSCPKKSEQHCNVVLPGSEVQEENGCVRIRY